VNKNLVITISITFLLFAFIIFLIYLVYCYAYYNENQENVYLHQFNHNDFAYVFEYMDKGNLNKEDFMKPIEIMYDKQYLKNLYYLYYEGKGNLSLNDFINIYYYGDRKITKDAVDFIFQGKTDFIKRRKLQYKSIDLENKIGEKSSLGRKKNIKLYLENNSLLELDEKGVACLDNVCIIDEVFGGLHTIKYISNQIVYFGIINIVSDEQVVDVSTLESLVKVEDKKKDMVTSLTIDSPLSVGKYNLNQCFLSYGCPSKKHSYIVLQDDKTAEFYTYITLDKAGDTYKGTYEITGDFLILSFAKHIYRVFDYDTKEATDIEAEVNVEMRFKIEGDGKVCNDSYCFLYNA